MSVSGALPHKTGGFRAYKKIKGREFQFYFRDKASADKKQHELNALASLATKSPVSKCGRLVGIRFQLRKRAGRKPYILVKVQLGPQKSQYHKEWKYDGEFEKNWQTIRERWIAMHGLSKRNVADYADELREAKRMYIRDVAAFEAELKTLIQ